MRSRLHFLANLARGYACCALLLGCGSSMVSGVVRSPDFNKYRDERSWLVAKDIQLLKKPPGEPYAVVGTIDIRALRPKPSEQLIAELRRNAQRLDADAVLPPPQTQRRDVAAAGILSPVQPFVVFDDGRTQTLEAQAIRYQRAPSERRHHFVLKE